MGFLYGGNRVSEHVASSIIPWEPVFVKEFLKKVLFFADGSRPRKDGGHSSHIPAYPRANPRAAPNATSRTKCTPVRTRPMQMSTVMPTMAQPTAG